MGMKWFSLHGIRDTSVFRVASWRRSLRGRWHWERIDCQLSAMGLYRRHGECYTLSAVLKKRSAWGGLVATGFITLLAGVGILATDGKEANHDYGWALAAIGAVAIVVGGIVYLILSKDDDDDERTITKASGHGIAVTSVGQRGGQTAGIIQNVGPQPRSLQSVDSAEIGARLSRFAGTEVTIAALTFDAESQRFAVEIRALVERAGWKPQGAGISATYLDSRLRGLLVRTPESTLPPSLEEFRRCFSDLLAMQVEIVLEMSPSDGSEIVVGSV